MDGNTIKIFLQKLVGPKLFTLHATILIILRTTCYGYFSGILTTLERRFQLSSSEAGTLVAVNDISELCLIVIVAHFGHKSHRPRWIAIGSVVMSIGMLFCAIPHFTSDPLDPKAVVLGINAEVDGNNMNDESFGDIGIGLCRYSYVYSINGSVGSEYLGDTAFSSSDECVKTSGHLGPVAWIVVGQMLLGIGSAPTFPLILSYIDDSVDKVLFTSYTAIIFMAYAIGPPVGLLMGAWSSSFYVDFNRISPNDIPDIPQEDPRWIGAWWIGFIICFILLLVCGVPAYFYPRSMSDYKRDQDIGQRGHRKEEMAAAEEKAKRRSRQSLGENVIERTVKAKGIFRSLKRMLTNTSLTLLVIGLSAELAMIGIFGSFGIKYMQTQFGLSPTGAAGIFGGTLVPVSVLSNIASAYICRRFKLHVRGALWLTIIFVSLSVPILPIMMAVGCPNSEVAGVTVDYAAISLSDRMSSLDDQSRIYEDDLTSTCNVNCDCPDEIFQPVCGSDSVTYISPCHAGCTMNTSNADTDMIYSECGCVNTEFNQTATPGQCSAECPASSLIVFVITSFIVLFFMASIQNPVAYILMRIVHDRDRSTVVGWKIFVTKCFGYFPSLVYFGAIINSTCTLWQYTCGERGSCWLYDIVSYRHAFFGTLLGLRCFAIICYLIMMWFLKPDDRNDNDSKEQNVLPTDETTTFTEKETDVVGP